MSGTQRWVGLGTLAVGIVFIAGASTLKAEAGYAGVGPNFLPWVVGLALAACGGFLVYEASSGGYRDMEEPSGAPSGHWAGFAWVSAGLLLNAALITTIGFILSCALCFALAVRGFRSAEGRSRRHAWIADLAIGAAIAAPVYWMFTKLLAINLPGLTTTGWV